MDQAVDDLQPLLPNRVAKRDYAKRWQHARGECFEGTASLVRGEAYDNPMDGCGEKIRDDNRHPYHRKVEQPVAHHRSAGK